MPRKPRFNLPGYPQHLIQRGNNQQACFFREKDYHTYLSHLDESAGKHGCRIHAYVLMTNHVHLLATPDTADGLSRMMQALGGRYVRYINASHGRSGTLWEGRYKASLVDSDRYLLTCYRYIELNPVRAGMVRRPVDYRWSSYRCHAEGLCDGLVRDHDGYIALSPDPVKRRRAYQELCTCPLDPAILEELRGCTASELVFGTERFKDEIGRVVTRRVRPGRAGRPRKRNKSEEIE